MIMLVYVAKIERKKKQGGWIEDGWAASGETVDRE
jgi:hypothetical protein